MSFNPAESKVKELRQGEDGFMLADGMIRYPRAMLHVTPDCPHQVAEAISHAARMGWLKCVAHIYKHEETFNIMADKS
jgi:hypothetical protein